MLRCCMTGDDEKRFKVKLGKLVKQKRVLEKRK